MPYIQDNLAQNVKFLTDNRYVFRKSRVLICNINTSLCFLVITSYFQISRGQGFPAIGTKEMKYDARAVAAALLQAVTTYCQSPHVSATRRVSGTVDNEVQSLSAMSHPNIMIMDKDC